ncbi:TPA: hypothetical protein ACH3X2_000961 [Trebouxia sp. C0005]
MLQDRTARCLELRKEMTNLRLIPGEDLTKYIVRARTTLSDLTLAGQSTPDSEVVLAVLNGLPQPCDIVVTVLTVTEKQLTLEGFLPTLLPVQQKLDAEGLQQAAFSWPQKHKVPLLWQAWTL